MTLVEFVHAAIVVAVLSWVWAVVVVSLLGLGCVGRRLAAGRRRLARWLTGRRPRPPREAGRG